MNRLQNIFLVGLLALTGFFMAPAQALNNPNPNSKSNPNSNSNSLTIGVTYYPPFVYHGSTGFDVEVMRDICTSQGLACTFVVTTFDAALADLKTPYGKFDAAMGAISITHQRLMDYDFVGPYYQSTMSFLAKQGTLNEQVLLPTLLKKTIGVEKSSTFYHYLAEAARSDEHLKVYKDGDELLQALMDEDVDAIALDSPVAQYWQQKSHCKLNVVGPAIQIPQDRGYGIVLRKNNVVLKNALSQGLQKAQADGALSRLIPLYFSDSLSNCMN